MILSFPPLEERALVILRHGLLLLGGVELLGGDFLGPGLVGDDPLLDLLGGPAQPGQEWI